MNKTIRRIIVIGPLVLLGGIQGWLWGKPLPALIGGIIIGLIGMIIFMPWMETGKWYK